jgi:hypothetical protein
MIYYRQNLKFVLLQVDANICCINFDVVR